MKKQEKINKINTAVNRTMASILRLFGVPNEEIEKIKKFEISPDKVDETEDTTNAE